MASVGLSRIVLTSLALGIALLGALAMWSDVPTRRGHPHAFSEVRQPVSYGHCIRQHGRVLPQVSRDGVFLDNLCVLGYK